MSINFNTATTAAIQDPSRIAVQLLLNELRGAAFVWPLARDLSDQVFDGSLTVLIPRAKGYAVGDAPSGVGTGADAFANRIGNTARTFNRDTLVIDRFKQVSDYIFDLDQDRSRVDLRANFLTEAPASLAEYLEADATEILYRGVTFSLSAGSSNAVSSVTSANYVRFSGAGTAVASANNANAIVEVSQLDDIAIRMSQVKIPKSDRIFLASPKQARLLAANSSIRDASQYGTNEAILNGEVARISGFRIVESPFLSPGVAVAFHRDAIYRAILEDAAVESSRQHEILADLLTITVKYGMTCPREGGLIFPMGEYASHLAAVQAGVLANQTIGTQVGGDTAFSGGVPGETENPANAEGSGLDPRDITP